MRSNYKNTVALMGVFAAASLSGCATIINGSGQNVSFKSTPSHATVTVDGKEQGVTPFTANLDRSENHAVKVTHTGCYPTYMRIRSGVNGGTVTASVVGSSILLGPVGLIGAGIDGMSGANDTLHPNDIAVKLVPKRISASRDLTRN